MFRGNLESDNKMAILLRNKPTDFNQYKVTDLSIIGTTYIGSLNQTVINILATDLNHDAINIGDYLIPMRGGLKTTPEFSSFDINDPLEKLKIINKSEIGSSVRTLTINGNQTHHFPGGGSSSESPEGYYSSSGIKVSKIRRGRKYKIVNTGSTYWPAFGSLHLSTEAKDKNKKLAEVGASFIATASGSNAGESAESPSFAESTYRGGIGGTDSPYIISNLTTNGVLDVNGTYNKITSYVYQNEANDIRIQLRGATDSSLIGRWTVWNPVTGKIYFEDENFNSTLTSHRFDSPAIGSDFRPSVDSNTPSVKWIDRTVSVSSDLQYTDNISDNAGDVIEVLYTSSMLGLNKPLTNSDVDGNFISLETTKLASDGSQPLTGNLNVTGDIDVNKLNVSDSISVGGAVPYSSNTGLTLGTKDIEVNNIRLSGVINDDALFRKYSIVAFPHSFIGDYNTKHHAIEPCTILYFSNIEDFNTGEVITASVNNKAGTVRRVNREYGYIMISNNNSINNWLTGDTIVGKSNAGEILKVLAPSDYIKPHHQIRIFGINQSDSPLATTFNTTRDIVQQPAKRATPTVTGKFTKPGSSSYTYRVAIMNTKTGKISELSNQSTTISAAPKLDEFDKNNYIQISGLERINTDHNILIYRQKDGESDFYLIDVWGNSDLGTSSSAISVNDYGYFNKGEWSVLNDNTNNFRYTSELGVTYLPITSTEATQVSGSGNSGVRSYVGFVGGSNKYKKGFLDTKVSSVGVTTHSKNSPAFFRISETENYNSPNINLEDFDSPSENEAAINSAPYGKTNEIEFFIDNGRLVDSPTGSIVGGIQKLILDSIADGRRSITLPGGVYYSRLITIPSNFKFSGVSDRNTTLKLLPWLDDSQNTTTPFGGSVIASEGYADNGSTRRTKEYVNYFNEFIGGDIGTSTQGSVVRFNTKAANDAQLSSAGIFNGVYGGEKSYSKVLVDFDGKSNIEFSNIKVDGNIVNQVVTELNVSGKSNFLVSGQLSKNVTIKNVSIVNSALSGFYGEEMDEVVIEGSTISKGGLRLEDSTFATGIYAPGSERVRGTSNLVESFSASNDFTSNTNSTLTGNIIRDTGSGVLAYASSNFVHESNLILGPANEFIPVVDTLNSEYDQININLINESGATGSTFTSDIITFLRDNSPLNLHPIDVSSDGIGISITTNIRTLVQSGTQSYFLPDEVESKKFNFTYGDPNGVSGYAITTPLPNTSETEANLSDGNIQLKITGSDVGGKLQALFNNANYGSLLSDYQTLQSRPLGESLVGLVYDVVGTEYLYMSDNDEINILWDKVSVDLTANQQEITFRIDSNYANLFATGDRVIFSLGVNSSNVGGIGTLSKRTLDETDANDNPIYLAMPVKSKVVGAATSEIAIGISDSDGVVAADRVGLSEIDVDLSTLNATTFEKNNCRLGIQNKFSIAKGRIIV